MFVTTQFPATNLAPVDVCYVPVGPVISPLPFPNISFSSVSVPNIYNIFVWAMPAQNNMTITPVSVGGAGPGTISAATFGGSRMLVSSVKTFFGGMPVNKCFGTTSHNGLPPVAAPYNSLGSQTIPSQVTLSVLT